MEGSERRQVSLLSSFVVASFAAAIGKSVTAPVERTKLMISTGAHTKARSFPAYMVMVAKQEGVQALWRGNLWNLRFYVPYQCFVFVFFEQMMKMTDNPFLSGAMAGSLVSAIFYPLDISRVRLAHSLKSGSPVQESRSISNLYRGFTPTCIGVAVYRSMYFGLYFTAKKHLLGEKSQNFLLSYLIAHMSTTYAHFMSYPIDTVRRRLMMTQSSMNSTKLSLRSLPGHIFREEGINGFFKGSGAILYRSIVGAITITVYDMFTTFWSSTPKGIMG